MRHRSIAPLALSIAAALLSVCPMARAQNEGEGHGRAIVTVLPRQGKNPAPDISQESVQVEVNGKQGQIANWRPLRGADAAVELVILIDNDTGSSFGRTLSDVTRFVQGLPPNVKVAMAYMQNGQARLAGPLSADHAAVAKQIHMPLSEVAASASPYFCLSDLAKHWPSQDRAASREVVMITDGVDRYELRYDPDDPYVNVAIQDSARAGLVVYSMYWRGVGRVDRSWYENNAGQNLLQEVTQATGGNSYWIGTGNPVTLQPYFEDLSRRLNDQFELGLTAPLRGKPELESLKIKISAPNVKVTAPQKVWVAPQGSPMEQ